MICQGNFVLAKAILKQAGKAIAASQRRVFHFKSLPLSEVFIIHFVSRTVSVINLAVILLGRQIAGHLEPLRSSGEDIFMTRVPKVRGQTPQPWALV